MEQNTLRKQRELTDRLNRYRNEYYNYNNPSVSDEVYDRLFDELHKLEQETGIQMSNSPTVTVGYPVVGKLEKTAHKIPLLSLDKVKSSVDLCRFMGEHQVMIMLKLDGLTIKLTYENGELVEAATRGDGDEGEIVTHNARAISGIPAHIQYPGRLVVTGEAFIRPRDFERLNTSIVDENGETYKNGRNLAAGSVRLRDAGECMERCVTFMPFNVLEGFDDLPRKSERLKELRPLGFTPCKYLVTKRPLTQAETEDGIKQLARAISPTTMITILPVGWLLYTGGSLPIETFITTIVLSLGIAGPLLAAMDFVDSLAKVGTIVGSVDAILNGAEQDHGEASVEFRGRDIKLSHVSFGYHADKEVLHDVSLTIPAGSMTAFVGPSGSGKSTIAKLIAGFWDVTSGSITLGGQDLKRVPLKQLYDQVAFVSQDNYLFDESIRENIRMGRPAATDAEVEAVAKAAGCDAFIRGLERGYDTVVGGGGAHLSGGERQRIAIARAMLKDAPIVVLDEATAYIDPENEAVVQQAVGKLVAGKTVLVIAHRLSTITGADQIVVVNGGRIQDAGTHEELLKNCPLYQEMWRAHMGAKEGEQA